jgi:hypothetical protein
MTDIDNIEDMKKEIAYLMGELKEFHAAMKLASDDTTSHIVYIYKYLKLLNNEIEHIYDVVGPIEEKIFPNVRDARRKLWSIMEEIEKRSAHERDPKND